MIKDEDIKQHVEDVLKEIFIEGTNDVDYEAAKKHVCKFYTGNPGCFGCRQNEPEVEACAQEYASGIVARPQLKWSPDWEEIEVREKINISDLSNIGLSCDKCYLSDNCPVYKAKATCSISWDSGIANLKPEKAIEQVIKIQGERVERARVIEVMDGGVPDLTLSAELDRLSGLIATKADMESDKFSLKIEANAKGSGGSILEKFFGGGLNKNTQQPQIEEGNMIPIQEAIVLENTLPEVNSPHYEEKASERKTPRKTARKKA